jgi:hypothetical protein
MHVLMRRLLLGRRIRAEHGQRGNDPHADRETLDGFSPSDVIFLLRHSHSSVQAADQIRRDAVLLRSGRVMFADAALNLLKLQ